jgi:hypothetical protein
MFATSITWCSGPNFLLQSRDACITFKWVNNCNMHKLDPADHTVIIITLCHCKLVILIRNVKNILSEGTEENYWPSTDFRHFNSVHVGFVMENWNGYRFSSNNFGFSWQFSSHQQLHNLSPDAIVSILSMAINTNSEKNKVHLCGLLVRVPGYRSSGPGSTPR